MQYIHATLPHVHVTVTHLAVIHVRVVHDSVRCMAAQLSMEI